MNALHKKQPFKGRKGPFKCQLCGKNVTAAGTLRAHYRSHAGNAGSVRIRNMRKVSGGQPRINSRLSPIFLRSQPIEDLMKNINIWMSTDNNRPKGVCQLCRVSGRQDNHLFQTLNAGHGNSTMLRGFKGPNIIKVNK